MSGLTAFRFILLVSLLLSLFCTTIAIPEQGIHKLSLNESSFKCDDSNYEVKVLSTKFRGSYFRVKLNDAKKEKYLVQLGVFILNCGSQEENLKCVISSERKILDTDSMITYMISNDITVSANDYLECEMCLAQHENMTVEAKVNNKTVSDKSLIAVEKDGIYLLLVSVRSASSVKNLQDVTVEIESRDTYGFLSAADWPQLLFFRLMFVIYFFYTFVWLVLCCCHRNDLLRIQYWIGGVIFIGLIEKAVFLGEYETLNKTGQSVYGAVIFGELVSSAKKMLSRMLVIIVSVGFGIVKPRLGNTLHKVLAVGLIYFIASSVEGCQRAIKERVTQDRMMLVSELVLAIIDACICWWIFSSLVQTMRILRVRRNVVKLSLYRHFTNTLIFAVLASVGFMIWSTIEHKYVSCIKDWKELWVDEAFWHLLFAILLLVIMVLWRPSANNQRYAYSPLTDAADDEAEEPMINEAFDGIKMRGTKTQENNSNKADVQMDDDLKWVEDNIPASVIDSALPSLLDSEEEIVTTTYERGKMQ